MTEEARGAGGPASSPGTEARSGERPSPDATAGSGEQDLALAAVEPRKADTLSAERPTSAQDLGERPTEAPPPPSGQTRLSTPEPRACPNCTRMNVGDARFCNACGLGLLGDEPVILLGGDPLVGRVLGGRYRIDEVIGRGGMGVVYRVEHVRMGKLMAVKLLHGELARDREVVRRFHREAEAVSKLDHPHTVQVFDFGESDGMTWLVMELLSGRDLGALLTAESTLDFVRAARIVWQIAGSVQQAHERGIVHRDLKPENVRILSDRAEPDFVKVMDFGLAKLRETEEQKRASITRDGFLVGTPYYMAPEHIRGDAVDARTDVYALGAMLYKMIAGVPPFWAPTPVAVLTKHLSDEPVPPSRKSPRRDLPPECDAIILKALSKSPADRQQSMNELREELAPLLGVSTSRPPNTGRTAAPKIELATESGRKIAVATRDDVDRFERTLATQDVLGRVALVALALLAAGTSWWAWGAGGPAAPRHETEPNDVAAAPGEVWLGQAIEGHLGARLDVDQGDVDVYRVVGLGPDDSHLRIDESGLPNVDTVVELFVLGRPDPLLVIDSGGVGAPERVPAFPIDPSARYVVRVREGAALSHLPTENVSDRYLLSVTAVRPGEGEEREPNDTMVQAEPLAVGQTRTAFLGWPGDVDVFCVEPGPSAGSIIAVSGVPGLDVALVVVDRVTGGESHVDAAPAGEGESLVAASDHATCVRVVADADGARSDPARSYSLTIAPPG